MEFFGVDERLLRQKACEEVVLECDNLLDLRPLHSEIPGGDVMGDSRVPRYHPNATD